jgi:hypothetical protein
MLDFGTDGAELHSAFCSEVLINQIEGAIRGMIQDRPGVRMFGVPALADILSRDGAIGQLAADRLGSGARPVRAILFDKSPETNWALGWHQDRVIAVRQRLDVPGYGPWTVKAGVHHVAPPIEVIEQMITLRVHIDPVSTSNAPLQIACGSHRIGLVLEEDIEKVVGRSRVEACLAERGDVWAYVTPILHASNAASAPKRRRVLQVDYSALALPDGLEWLGV